MKDLSSKPINLKKGEIKFFDGKKNIATIRDVNFKYRTRENIDEITLKGDFLNDWREFDNSVQQLTQEYADQIEKTEKRWVADKTNMKYKESKEYFTYIREKLASAR